MLQTEKKTKKRGKEENKEKRTHQHSTISRTREKAITILSKRVLDYKTIFFQPHNKNVIVQARRKSLFLWTEDLKLGSL